MATGIYNSGILTSLIPGALALIWWSARSFSRFFRVLALSVGLMVKKSIYSIYYGVKHVFFEFLP